jgi:RHS repeat-associated protein
MRNVQSPLTIPKVRIITSGLKPLILVLVFFGAFVFAQAQTRNYVRTWVATAPEANPNTLITRPLTDVKQSTAYFDGLGRLEQTVVKKGSLSSAGNFDLVSPSVYDAFGREAQKYLPYAATSNDGLFKTSAVTEQNSFYAGGNSPVNGQGESYFYSKTVFEASPLNRALESFAPGINWAGTSGQSTEGTRNSVKAKYYVNTITDSVRIWNVTDVANDFGTYATPSTNGIYAPGLLYKNITVDEMGKQVIEFKDKQGQVMLKKVQLTGAADNNGTGQGHTGWLCTYYIYDDLNQLRAVIQPSAVQALVGSWTLTTSQLDELCFRYEYDARGRMIMKKVPGAGVVHLVYDSRDRLVMSQDANMRLAAYMQWLVTQYDDLNRPVVTYLITDPANYTNASWHRTQAATTPSVSIPSYPNVGSYTNQELTRTFYDNYTWLSGEGNPFTGSFNNSYSTYYLPASTVSYPYALTPSATSLPVTGAVTGTKIKVLGQATYLYTINFYDDKGRIVQVQSKNITNGTDIMTTQYSFSGQPLIAIQKQEKAGTAAQTTVVVSQMTYDDLGRITKTEKKLSNTNVNGNAMPLLKTVFQNEYDAIGQLKKKKVGTKPGASTELAKMDYEYNIRGWLLSVNKTYTSGTNTDQYFAMELGYDKNPSLGAFTTAQYTGNIAGTVWRSAGDGAQRKYDFTYDAVNRLSGATFNQYVSGSGAGATFNTSAGLDFSVSNLTYDANGNILTQSQKGWKISGSDYIDQLTYNYPAIGNKLTAVTDGANDNLSKLGDFKYDPLTKTSTDYTYDGNGNLVTDVNKKIASITYNHLNLPGTITVTSKGTIQYIYDAGGNKLQKISTENNATVNYSGTNYTTNITSSTTYIGSFIYESKAYSNTTLNTALGYIDELKFLSHEEGRIRFEKPNPYACTAQQNRFVYDYFIKDHLGNVRMVVTEQNDPVCYIAATSEDSRLTNEQKIYDITSTRRKTLTEANIPSGYTQFESKVYETNGSDAAKRIGLGAVIKVTSGDNVLLTCQSYYNMPASGRTDNNYMAITDLLGALVNSGGVAAKGAMTSNEVYNYSTNATNLSPFLQSTPQPYTANAYLNWIVFDEQMKYVAGGADPVNPNGGYKLHVPSTIPITKNGFLYVYVSNESNYPVYFDNLNITHTPGAILEETHYYPFGLTMAGISSRAAGALENKKNKFQNQEFASKEFSDGSGLEIYEFKYRMHDPQTGRFWQIDPLSDKYVYNSTYAFSENKVTGHIELEGLEAISFVDAKKEHNKDIINAANKNNDKSALHIYAHGNSKIFYNENGKTVQDQQITSGKTLNRLLNKASSEWKNSKDHSNATVVLHSCRTGRTTTGAKGNEVESVAQKISSSKEFKDVTIIAPTERDFFNSDGEVGPRVANFTDDNGDYKNGTSREKEGQATSEQGGWNVFKNGKLIATYDGDWTPKGNPSKIDNFFHKN